MRFILLLVSFFALASTAPAAPAIPLDKVAVIDQPIFQNNLEPISQFISKADKEVHLIINSPGGSVGDGFSLLNRMDAAKKRGVKIHCYVPEIAASMAFQILLHCDTRYALPRAGLLWHRVSVQVRNASVNALVATDLVRELLSVDRLIIEDLKQNVNAPVGVIVYHLNHETMHLAQDLNTLAPGFFEEIPPVIENLYEAMDSTKVVRQSSPMDFLKRLFGGGIFYISREFVIEAEAAARK